jgi:O-antigen ligase
LWFVSGVVISIIICAGVMLNGFIHDPDYFNYFSRFPLYVIYSRFSIFHHTSYFTLFLVFSIAVLFYFIRTKQNNSLRKFLIITLIIIISALTICLSSRAGIIGLLVVLLWNILSFLQKKINWLSVSILVLVSALPLLIFIKNDQFGRFIEKAPYKEIFQEEIKNVDNNSFERIYIWHSAVKVIKQNWFFGVGTGDVKDNMKLTFRKNGFVDGVKRNYNAHNQFLETWTGLGIIGEIILLTILIYGLVKGIKNRDILLQSFIILIFVHFFFESMLNRLAGIIFFSYFYSLLLYRNNIKT